MISRDDAVHALRRLLVETTATRKHSAYQRLPDALATMIGDFPAALSPKHEAERLMYIRSKVPLENKALLDIGCNTGYFSFESLSAGACNVVAFEGSQPHYEFAVTAAAALGLTQRFNISNEFFTFTANHRHYDVALVLNVLHHIGDDFGERSVTMVQAKQMMLESINAMSVYVDTLVLQLGFNWKGDITQCLFPHGTKREMIDFIAEGVDGHWSVDAIGIAEGTRASLQYEDLTDTNIARRDDLGEFLNRPLFVLRACRRPGG